MFGLNPLVFFAVAYPIFEYNCFCAAFSSPSASNNVLLASFEGNHLVTPSPGLRTQDTLAYLPEMNQTGTGIERRRPFKKTPMFSGCYNRVYSQCRSPSEPSRLVHYLEIQ
jgi:hypothetical protein